MKFEYEDLLRQRLVNVRFDQERGLKLVKYSKRVFYDALWNADPRLLQARGIVLDNDNNIVSLPFDKVFNYQENGTTLPYDCIVWAHRKVNGFLICATYISLLDDVVIHTNGTFDSDFVKLGQKWIEQTEGTLNMIRSRPDCTFMFEVCDVSDPHIVPEEEGLHFLAYRRVDDGTLVPSFDCTVLAEMYGQRVPEVTVCRFGELLESMPTCRHEGYVCYVNVDGVLEAALKLKSPYYLVTKFLGRNKKTVAAILADPVAGRQKIDEEFYPLVEWLAKNYGPEFVELPEQERVTVVRGFFKTV